MAGISTVTVGINSFARTTGAKLYDRALRSNLISSRPIGALLQNPPVDQITIGVNPEIQGVAEFLPYSGNLS